MSKVVDKIKGFKGKVLFTRDTHHENYMDTQEGKNLPVPHCIEGTEGFELVPEVKVLCNSKPIDKPVFGSAQLGLFLQEVPIVVDAGCCAGVTPESHLRALESMKTCQIEIVNE